jgi:hypothetical protein
MQTNHSSATPQRDHDHSHGATTAAVVAIAGVLAIVLLSLFVDALHQSIARGEALRERLASSSPSAREPIEAVAQANLLMARR